MHFQLAELVMTSLATVSAGLSYALYRGAKKYNDLSVQAARLSVISAGIARDRALDALRYSKDAADTFTNILTEEEHLTTKRASQNEAAILAVAKLSSTAGSHAETAKKFSVTAEEHAHTAYVNHLAAKGSMVAAERHVSAAAEQVILAESFVKSASTHADMAAEHRAACHDHVIDAGEHARSVGSLYTAVTDIAAQTKVRLVNRKDYSNDGSNIGGR